MSADFWGLKTAGGTATAYHLLAAMLAKSHALEVRLCQQHLLTGTRYPAAGLAEEPSAGLWHMLSPFSCPPAKLQSR